MKKTCVTILFIFISLGCSRLSQRSINGLDRGPNPVLPDPPTIQTIGSFNSYENTIKGEMAFQNGQLHKAKLYFEKALTTDPHDFLLRTNYANLLAQLGHLNRAKRQYAKALLLHPTAQVTWLKLAELYLKQGLPQQAIKAAQNGALFEPTTPDALLWLGTYHFDQQNLPMAQELFNKVLRHWPNNADALLGLGRVSFLQGNFNAAQNALQKYVQFHGFEPEGISTLIKTYEKLDQPLKAIDLLELSIQAAAMQQRPKLISLLIEVGLYTKAEKHIDALESVDPSNPDALVQRALQLNAIGRSFKARKLVVDYEGSVPINSVTVICLAKIEIELARFETAAALLNNPDVTFTKQQKSEKARLINLINQKRQVYQPHTDTHR